RRRQADQAGLADHPDRGDRREHAARPAVHHHRRGRRDGVLGGRPPGPEAGLRQVPGRQPPGPLRPLVTAAARTLTLPYRSPAGAATGAGEYAVESAVLGSPRPPTTLFLHGLAGSIQDTRPLASGLPGRKVFAHLPGHGRSTGPDPLDYDA